MRAIVCGVLTALAAVAVITPATADGNVNFAVGSRNLVDKEFWDPTEDQSFFGGSLDVGGEKWPINIAIGLYASARKKEFSDPILGTINVKGSMREATFGVMKTWKMKGITRPYVGGGIALVRAKGEVDVAVGSASDTDTSTGTYVEGGVYWRLARIFNIGIHGRILRGTKVSIAGVDGDADYNQFGILFGWGWPERP